MGAVSAIKLGYNSFMSINFKRFAHATLLAIGIGGLIHLLSLFTLAISRGQLRYANPAYAVDLDQVFPSLNGAAWFFVFGWIGLAAIVGIIYYLLGRSNQDQ